jgi:hypothetical protein
MRRILAGLAVGTVLAAPGCDVFRNHREPGPGGARAPAAPRTPEVPQLVSYLNENARRAPGVRATVIMDASEGEGLRRNSVSLDGYLACSRPRNFRLKAQVLGKPAVDIGSNEGEFWYWISQNNPPYVYHCSYQDLAKGVSIPIPFQPDMVLAALGMAEYDPAKPYKVKESARFLELVEESTTPQGKAVERVTVFNRMEARTTQGQAQVVGHILRDTQGHVICQAIVEKVTVSPETGAVLPQQVSLQWPDLKVQMKLQLRDTHVATFDTVTADRYFQRRDLLSYQSFDLARGGVDGPGIQRAGLR